MVLHKCGLLLSVSVTVMPPSRQQRFKKKRKEIKNRSLDRAAALLADTTGQLLVPQIHRMPWCLPTVLSNSWAGA